MALTVQAKLRSALKPEATVLIEVRAADPDGRLDGVLHQFGDSLAGRKFASPPIPVPGGRVMMIDLGDVPRSVLREAPDRLVAGLAEAGFTDAVITVPKKISGRHTAVTGSAPAARTFLAGSPGTGADLLSLGLDWLRSAQPGPALLDGVVISAEVPLTWDNAGPVSAAVLSAGATACLVASDLRTEVAAIAVNAGPPGWAADGSLTACTTDGRAADQMRVHRDLVASHAKHLLWAGVTVEPDAARLWVSQFQDRPADGEERAPYGGYSPFLTDRFAGDALWFQVLSAGHLQRLGGPPPGSAPLPGGRVAVTVGEPEQWLPGHPDRAEVKRRARELLAPLLLNPAAVGALLAERRESFEQSDGDGR